MPILNERDYLIQSSAQRMVSANTNYIRLSAPYQYFRIDTNDNPYPTQIEITADFVGILTGTCTFAVIDGQASFTVDTENQNKIILAYADLLTDTVTIRASLDYVGVVYTADISISRVSTGATGTDGDSVDIIFRRFAPTITPTIAISTTGIPEGWYSNVADVPDSNTDPLYFSIGKYTPGTQDYYWQTPKRIEGSRYAEVSIFKRSSTVLDTAPIGGSFNFATMGLTPPDGWSLNIPAGESLPLVYVSRAIISTYSNTDIITSIDWTVPTISYASNITAILKSQADIVSTDSYGANFILPSGNKLELYSGTTLIAPEQINYSGSATQGGLTCTIDSTGLITLSTSGAGWATTSESFSLTAEYGGSVYTVIYSIAKSIAGSTSVLADLLSETDIIFADTDGNNYTLPTGNKLNLYRGAEVIPGQDITFTVIAPATVDGLTANIDASGNISLSGNWSGNTASFIFNASYAGSDYSALYTLTKGRTGQPGAPGAPGADGDSAVFLDIDTSLYVVNTDYYGQNYTLPISAIATAVVYSGSSTVLNTLVSYSLLNSTKNGLSCNIDTNGNISISGIGWVTDKEEFTIQALYGGTTYLTKITILKNKQVTAPIIPNLKSEADIVSADSTGYNYTLPTGNQLLIYEGGTIINSTATGLVFRFAESLQNTYTIDGLTFSVSADGSITITGATWNSLSVTVTIQAVYSGNTYSKVYSLTKSIPGTAGIVFDIDPETSILQSDSYGNSYTLPLDGVTALGTSKLYSGGDIQTSGVSYYLTANGVGGEGTTEISLSGLPIKLFDNSRFYAAYYNSDIATYGSFDYEYTSGLVYYTGSLRRVRNATISGYQTLVSNTTEQYAYAGAVIMSGTTIFGLASGTTLKYGFTRDSTGVLTKTVNGVQSSVSGYDTIPTNVKLQVVMAPYNIVEYYIDEVLVHSEPNVDCSQQLNYYISIYHYNGYANYITFGKCNSIWQEDSATFSVNAIYQGRVYTKPHRLLKVRQGSVGADGADGVSAITIEAVDSLFVVPANYNGTSYSSLTNYTTNIIGVVAGQSIPVADLNLQGLQVDNPDTTISINAITKVITFTKSGLVMYLNYSAGTITFANASTSNTWTTDSEQFIIQATYTGNGYNQYVHKIPVNIRKLKQGLSAINYSLTSEADVITANDLGTGYVLPTGNSYKLYYGNEELTTGVTYLGTATKNGLTLTINSVGAITLSGTNWTTDTESFTLSATYSGLTYTKIYTISKSKAGSDVLLIDLSQESVLYPANTDGTTSGLPSANYIKLYKGGVALTSGVTYNVSGGSVVTSTYNHKAIDGLDLYVNKSTGYCYFAATSNWSASSTLVEFTLTATYNNITYSSTYSITKAKTGASGSAQIALDLQSEADVVATDATGSNYTLPGEFFAILYQGGNQLTGVNFNVAGSTTQTKSGLKLTVGATTGSLILSGASWTSDSEYFDINAIYNGITYTQRYIITKSKQGVATVLIDLAVENVLVPALYDGSGYTLPTSNYIRVYQGGTIVTTGVSYGILGSTTGALTKNGLTCTVYSTNGEAVLTGTGWSSDSEYFDLKATYNGVEYTARYIVTKNKSGIPGVGTAGKSSRVCYSITSLASLATTPTTILTTGDTTFPPNGSWGTGTVWGASLPTNPTAGQTIYRSDGEYDPATNKTTWKVPYIAYLKVGQLSAITADLGTITAGSITGTSLKIGTNPAVSGSSMSGNGLVLNTNGTFAMGDIGTNMSFDGQTLTLNGDIVTAANIQQGAVLYLNTAINTTQVYLSTAYLQESYTQVATISIYSHYGQTIVLQSAQEESTYFLLHPGKYSTATASNYSRGYGWVLTKNNVNKWDGSDFDTYVRIDDGTSSFIYATMVNTWGSGYTTVQLKVFESDLTSINNSTRITSYTRGIWFGNSPYASASITAWVVK